MNREFALACPPPLWTVSVFSVGKGSNHATALSPSSVARLGEMQPVLPDWVVNMSQSGNTVPVPGLHLKYAHRIRCDKEGRHLWAGRGETQPVIIEVN